MRRTGGGWNKGVRVGKKRPFTPEQVQMIRLALKAKRDLRGLALFESSLSAMLRASDLLALKVADVLHGETVIEEIEIGQRKTGGGVKVALSPRARGAICDYLTDRRSCHGLHLDAPLWEHRGGVITRKRYAEMVKQWALLAHADPRIYSTHSMRRTMAKHVYEQTHDAETVRQLLGHASIASTSTYLDIERNEALATKKKFEL